MTNREVIRRHSKSFALAARLLPPVERRRAESLYAWCRAADDAVDHAPTAAAAADTLDRLRDELDAVYGGGPVGGAAASLRAVVAECGLPRAYPLAMLDGFAMDAAGTRYRTADELLVYCHRVAGVVGLMMCHAFGVTDPEALARADALGRSMQLVNVARDVAEDWARGRLYLPAEWLPVPPTPDEPLDDGAFAPAVRRALELAGDLHRSGVAGLKYLPPRCRFAVRVAALVYAEIGREVARRGCRVSAGRAVVPRWRKAWLVLKAAAPRRVAA